MHNAGAYRRMRGRIMRVRASMRGEIPLNEWVVRGGLAGIKGVVKYSLNTH